MDKKEEFGSASEAACLANAIQVAWYLQTSRARVYELCRSGMLPHTKVGRQLRFSPARIIAWVENGGAALPGGWRKEAAR
jgi:excisionase family DNA binding protein